MWKSRVGRVASVGLVVLVFGIPLQAQVMGICAGWMESADFPPGSLSSDCTLATPALEIGTTLNSNPTFNIGVNDGGVASNVTLLALIPQSSTTGLNSLTFTATFTQGIFTNPVNASAFSPPSGLPYVWTPDNQLLVSSYLSSILTAINTGADYHFDNINNLQVVPGTMGYSAYVMDTGFGVLGPTLTNGPTLINVSFSNFSAGGGFPTGTIFLALGQDADGNVIYFTPLTVGLQRVPEPSTMLLLGSGLAALAVLRRWRGLTRRPS